MKRSCEPAYAPPLRGSHDAFMRPPHEVRTKPSLEAKITKYAIENNLTELELLEVKMPHIEIYSRRMIKDPIYELTGRSYV